MEHETRHDAACAHIHPSKQQAHNEGVDALCHIEVYGAEERRRYYYGCPMPTHVKHIEQTAQYGSAKHHFFGYRGKNSNRKEAAVVAHYALKQLGISLRHVYAGLLYGKGHRHNAASGKANNPKQRKPRTLTDIVVGHWCPLAPGKEGYGEHAADDRAHYCCYWRYVFCLADKLRNDAYRNLYCGKQKDV